MLVNQLPTIVAPFKAIGLANEQKLGGAAFEHFLVDGFNTPDTTLWCTEIAWPIFRAAKH